MSSTPRPLRRSAHQALQLLVGELESDYSGEEGDSSGDDVTTGAIGLLSEQQASTGLSTGESSSSGSDGEGMPQNENTQETQEIQSQIPETDGLTTKAGHTWSTTSSTASPVGRISFQNILQKAPGVKTFVRARVDAPLDAWLEYIDRNMLRKIADYSNLSKMDGLSDITVDDLMAFIGLNYARGLYGKHIPVADLWSAKFGIHVFPKTMSRTKYQYIAKNIRFDNKNERSSRLHDRFTHVREIFDDFVTNCITKYVPESSLTIDEQLLPLKTRCKWITFMPNKPDKYGLKFWVLVEVLSKYVVCLSPYLGKDPSGIVTKDLGEKVVLDLIYKSGIGKGYNVTGDNYFTSVQLAQKLLQKGISYVGTLRRTKKEVCPKMLNKKRLHETNFFYLQNPKLLVSSYQCKSTKNVLVLSTMHDLGTISETPKRKPDVILYYNKNKCGVDCVDQMTRLYTTKTATRRWPVAVWANIMDMAAINAWIIYKKISGTNISRRKFVFSLVQQLTRVSQTPDQNDSGQPTAGQFVQPEPVVVLSKRRHCHKDGCSNVTVNMCGSCNKPVCGSCASFVTKYVLTKCNNC